MDEKFDGGASKRGGNPSGERREGGPDGNLAGLDGSQEMDGQRDGKRPDPKVKERIRRAAREDVDLPGREGWRLRGVDEGSSGVAEIRSAHEIGVRDHGASSRREAEAGGADAFDQRLHGQNVHREMDPACCGVDGVCLYLAAIAKFMQDPGRREAFEGGAEGGSIHVKAQLLPEYGGPLRRGHLVFLTLDDEDGKHGFS